MFYSRIWPLKSILEWRNTPTEGLKSSPVQRMMSRRTKTLLPTRKSLLGPDILKRNISIAIEQRKETQRRHYDTHSTPLIELISVGQAVRMKLSGRKTWSLGACKRSMGQRSYNFEVAGQTYRRIRRELSDTSEMAPLGTVDDLTSDEGEPEPTGQRQTFVVTFRCRRVLARTRRGGPRAISRDETSHVNQDA